METNRMKAAMLYGVHDLRIEEIEKPVITDEEDVIVKISTCGVCPTDVRYYSGTSKPVNYPVLLGHEVAGIVFTMGKVAERYFKEGERVAVIPDWPCHMCGPCRSGLVDRVTVSMCDNLKGTLGGGAISGMTGGFAEYLKVPYDAVFSVPNNVSDEEASVVEPSACCLNAVEWGGVKSGDNVLIIGSGFMGAMTAQLCKMIGAKVVITDLIDDKLNIAKQIGVDLAINVKKEKIDEVAREFTDGKGFNEVVISVGGEQPLRDAFGSVAKAGKIILLGSYHPSIKFEIDPNFFHYNMVALTGTEGYTIPQFQKILNFISQELISVKPLISSVFTFDEIEEAFKMVEKGEGMRKVVKIG